MVDPMKAAWRGRKAIPSWASGAAWLEVRAREITKLLLDVEAKLGSWGEGLLTDEEKGKWKHQAESLGEHLRSIAKQKRKATPFPANDGKQGKLGDLFERCQQLCQAVLTSWNLSCWMLGANWWQQMQAIANEAKAHHKQQEKVERAARNQAHGEWAEQAIKKGAGQAHKAAKPKPAHKNEEAPDLEGRPTGSPYSVVIHEVENWDKIWNEDVSVEEQLHAMKILNEAIAARGGLEQPEGPQSLLKT